MANCSSRKKGETEEEYRKRCGGYTYAFPIDLVQKEEPPKEEEPPVSEPPAPEGDDISVNESIGNMLGAVIGLGISAIIEYVLPFILSRFFRGLERTYYDIKDMISPEDWIKFGKKLHKNDEFNKQLINLLKQKFNKTPLHKFVDDFMNLPAFTNEFNKFIKDEDITDSNDIEKLKQTIRTAVYQSFTNTSKDIYKFLKKKYPELTKDLGESIYKFEARHTKGNIYKGKLKVDGNPVQVEVELVGVDNKTRSYLVRVIHIDRKYLSYLPKTGIIPIPARIFDIPGGGWVKVKTQGQFEGKLNEAIKPQNIVNYYKGVCKAVGISPIPIKFGSVGRLGAATTYHTKTFEPLYITFDLGKVRDIETAVLHEITHQILLIKEKNPYNNCAKRPAKFAKIENNLIEKFTYSPLSKLLYEMSMVALADVDKFADKQLSPINVVLTDKHFFDRLQDPRNQKDISSAELIGFFKRLGKNKNKFIEFLNQYGEIVAKDNKTKINIPFMKKANKVIAKTIMRKSNFVTSSPEYTFETIKKVDGKWVVYPKSGGDRLGTHSTYKDALKQLQAIEASKARNEDVFPGGLADKYSLDDLAKKHGVGVDEIKSQIAKGMKVEMEHTNDKKVAFEIAKDHVFEDPKYYDKLKTIENRIYELLKKKLSEDWTNKYKKSIDCNNPKGFSQKAHCAGRKARERGEKTKSNPVK